MIVHFIAVETQPGGRLETWSEPLEEDPNWIGKDVINIKPHILAQVAAQAMRRSADLSAIDTFMRTEGRRNIYEGRLVRGPVTGLRTIGRFIISPETP